MKDKFKGAVVGAAVADALGGYTENMNQEHATRFYEGGLRSHSKPLNYTDDTEMAVSVLESLSKRGHLDTRNLADHFVREFNHQRGYSLTFQALLETCKDGNDLTKNILTRKVSKGSCGAAMRTYPIGLFYAGSEEDLLTAAESQAKITHYHPEAITAAITASYAVKLALNYRGKEQFVKGLSDVVKQFDYQFARKIEELNETTDFDKKEFVQRCIPEWKKFGVSSAGYPVVLSALWSFLKSPEDFEATTLRAITLGGDTDSIATIAGAMSGAHNGESAISTDLRERVTEMPRLEKLADSLYEKSQVRLNPDAIRQECEERTQELAGTISSLLDTMDERINGTPLADVFGNANAQEMEPVLGYALDFYDASHDNRNTFEKVRRTHENIPTLKNQKPKEIEDDSEEEFWRRIKTQMSSHIRIRDQLIKKAEYLKNDHGIVVDPRVVNVLTTSARNGITHLSQEKINSL